LIEINLTDYPNILSRISLSPLDIENQIEKYPLEFSQIRRQDVEWQIKFPPFLPSFYDWVIKKHHVPKQIEFWENYLRKNEGWFNKLNFNDHQKEGLKARLYRTYPSLVRDLHFSIVLKNYHGVDKVIYNPKLDIEEGIDIIITHNNAHFAINLYVKTRRAFKGRRKKEFRHRKWSNLIYIELPVDFKNSKRCGEFFLYGKNEIEILEQLIKKKEHEIH